MQGKMSYPYPELLVVPPLRSHQHTFILLHGRGSSAMKFGPVLLSTPLSTGGTLASAFPHAKFVFPTASKSRAVAYKRSLIHQWFDNWPLAPENGHATTREDSEYLPIDGLRETSEFIHDLLRREIALVGGDARKVVLGGLSQGCAASLVSLLLWDGDPLAAAFGMCGWLPFRRHIEEDIFPEEKEDEQDEDFNPFGNDDSPTAVDASAAPAESSPAQRARICLQDLLEIPTVLSSNSPTSVAAPFQHIPFFLGHGAQDEKVPIHFGKEAADCLRTMAVHDVSWKKYPDLGHWYSGQLLADLVDFLQGKVGNVDDDTT